MNTVSENHLSSAPASDAAGETQSVAAGRKTMERGGEITIPDNIEEIIAAYLLQQLERLLAVNPYASIRIGMNELAATPKSEWKPAAFVYTGQYHPTTEGRSLKDVVDRHIEAVKAHDPAKAKRDAAARLLAEADELERGAK